MAQAVSHRLLSQGTSRRELVGHGPDRRRGGCSCSRRRPDGSGPSAPGACLAANGLRRGTFGSNVRVNQTARRRTMTACIVGWAHTPFGKLDSETVESLIVRVADEALEHAGIGPEDVDEIVLGHFNAGFSPQDFTASLVLAGERRASASSPRPGSRTPAPPARPRCTRRSRRSRRSAPAPCSSSASSR